MRDRQYQCEWRSSYQVPNIRSQEHIRTYDIIVSEAEWAKVRDDYLPSVADGDFISSLMVPVSEPGKFANWIAAPKVGIDNKPGDFEYVKIAA